ncbi:hypothetical protein GCM10009782_00760 [Glycomyces algeriensis]
MLTGRNATTPARASQKEALTPVSRAAVAAVFRRPISWSSALEALTVRKALKMRSRSDPMSPRAFCEAMVAFWMRGMMNSIVTVTNATMAMVVPNRARSSQAMRAMPPMIMNPSVTPPMTVVLATVRRRFVSELSRETRSPGLRRSTSATSRRTSRSMSCLRTVRTTSCPAICMR